MATAFLCVFELMRGGFDVLADLAGTLDDAGNEIDPVLREVLAADPFGIGVNAVGVLQGKRVNGQPLYGNGLCRSFGYNSRMQLASSADSVVQGTAPQGTTCFNAGQQPLALAYNWTDSNGKNDGNLWGMTTYQNGPSFPQALSFNATFLYDNANRLTWAEDRTAGALNWYRGFQYDQYGNMWTTPNGGTPVSGLMPQTNLYNAANQRGDAAYDPAGNQLTIGGTTLTYDAENRVVSAANLPAYGGGSETYVYDGDGRRVQKIVANGPTTTYVHDIFGKLIAEYSTNPPAPTPPCHTCYISTDHLGSTRLVTGDNATIIARHDYVPFGEEIPGGYAGRTSEWGATDNVNQKFTGQIRDQETGLDYFGARYMSSIEGRFVSPDPTFLNVLKVVNPQKWNLYGYAINNPLRYVDPDGEESIAVNYPNYQVGVRSNLTLPLGHAGVVIVARDGSTHYFEYGRYAPAGAGGDVAQGIVRNAGPTNTPTPPVERDASGKITPESMKNLLQVLSDAAGKHGPVEAAVFDTTEAQDAAMEVYLEERQAENSDPNRQHYSLFGGHNCSTLICDALSVAGRRAPATTMQLPANLFGYFSTMPSYFGVTQTFTFTPKNTKVTSKICYADEKGKEKCQ